MPPGTRTALLDAADELLDRGGVEAVTLREVGKRAGVSHNAPYKHFASKEALLAAVATRELDRRHDLLDAALGQQDDPAGPGGPSAALRGALIEDVDWARRHPHRFALMYGTWTVVPDDLARAAHAASAQLVDTVRAAQDDGALPPGDPERLTALLRAVVHGAIGLEAVGHLAPEGKGRSDAVGLVDDLLGHLRAT